MSTAWAQAAWSIPLPELRGRGVSEGTLRRFLEVLAGKSSSSGTFWQRGPRTVALMKGTGASRSTIKRARRVARELGVIDVLEQGGPGHTTQYAPLRRELFAVSEAAIAADAQRDGAREARFTIGAMRRNAKRRARQRGMRGTPDDRPARPRPAGDGRSFHRPADDVDPPPPAAGPPAPLTLPEGGPPEQAGAPAWRRRVAAVAPAYRWRTPPPAAGEDPDPGEDAGRPPDERPPPGP